MISYAVTRLLQAIPVLFLTSLIVFFFIRLVPGDPAVTMAGQNGTPQQIEAMRHRWGLDKPMVTQYLIWIGGVAHGDFGDAYGTQTPVSTVILQRIPATLHLAIGTLLVIVVLGTPIGVFTALRPNHPLSRIVAFGNALALATPTFWLGILLILFFAVWLRFLPPSGYISITENPILAIRNLILPCVTLGTAGTAVLSRYLKSSISEVLGADFIRTAQAKGLRNRAIVVRHVLKVALLPVITVMAIQFGYLLGGAVVTESIFGWPGIGRLILDSISNGEYLVVQGTMLVFVATFIVVNVLADVTYALLNPRIRYGH
jgi:peptide/nickel transport system permease protein